MNNYVLAKKLKDAGFPQETIWGYREHASLNKKEEPVLDLRKSTNLKELACAPTLSELIEECGKGYFILESSQYMGWQAFKGLNREIGYGNSFNTPEEAVAELWLELNK